MRKPSARVRKELLYCRDCAHCTVYDNPKSFSIHGTPTLGTCPYWTESKCVLLSQFACDNFAPKGAADGLH